MRAQARIKHRIAMLDSIPSFPPNPLLMKCTIAHVVIALGIENEILE